MNGMSALALLCLGVLPFGSLLADDTLCSNPSGVLNYRYSTYEGGPPPGPGMTVGEIVIRYKGEILDQQKTVVGQTTAPMDVQVLFDTKNQITIDGKDAQKPVGKIVYALSAAFSRSSGEPVLPEGLEKTVTDYFICSHRWNHLIP